VCISVWYKEAALLAATGTGNGNDSSSGSEKKVNVSSCYADFLDVLCFSIFLFCKVCWGR